jgi:hypothetical protein
MASRVIVRDTDRGYKKLLARVRKAAKDRSITVGIHAEEGGAAHDGSGTTVGDIASIHEFGLGNHPERSFIRAWFDADRQKHEDILRRLGISVVRGTNTVEAGLEKAGAVLAAECQGFIQSDRVSPKTIKQDPQDNPTTLIESSQLVSSITHKVEL